MDPELLHYALEAKDAADKAARFCASAIKAAKSAEDWHARAEVFAANAAYERAEADYAWGRIREQFRRLGIMVPDYEEEVDANDGDDAADADDEYDDGASAADEEIRVLMRGGAEGDGADGADEEQPRGAEGDGADGADEAGRRLRARREGM